MARWNGRDSTPLPSHTAAPWRCRPPALPSRSSGSRQGCSNAENQADRQSALGGLHPHDRCRNCISLSWRECPSLTLSAIRLPPWPQVASRRKPEHHGIQELDHRYYNHSFHVFSRGQLRPALQNPQPPTEKALFEDPEFRFYTLIVMIATIYHCPLGRSGGRYFSQDPVSWLPGGHYHDYHRLCHKGF